MDVSTTPEQTTTPPPDASGSLSDHERTFHGDGTSAAVAEPQTEPAAEPATPAAAAETDAERDDKGRFTKPRHRAQSQQASAEDVPRIRELTRRLREREAEIASLRAATTASRPPAPETAEPATPAVAVSGFPTFDVWIADTANEGKTFEDFIDARTEWKYRALRASERADEQRTSAQRDHQKAVDAYRAQLTDDFYAAHPDFDEVVDGVQVSKVVERAVLLVGPQVAYYLAQHPEEREALTEETAIDPTSPAFPAAVAAMRRYLATLVAPEQRASSPSRQAAVSTGSAPARGPVSVPRPPNPVRTAALRDGDQPPGDESSLADHEKAYWTRRRA